MWLASYRAARWTRALLLLGLALTLAIYHWWPQFDLLPRTADLDGRAVLYQIEIGKAAIRQYGEFPLWNPFDCRGIPMFDHPESMVQSPLLLATTWLDTATTLWVWNV